MHFADLVRDTGVEQDPLSCRRFPGINVSHIPILRVFLSET
jgi:hypothetical protein